MMLILGILLILIIAIIRNKPNIGPYTRYDSRGFDHNGIHKNGTKYDDAGFDYWGYDVAGFNLQGYNKLGRNGKGQYNRFYDSTSCTDEGFCNPKFHPIALTNHARERLSERLGLNNTSAMLETATDAYRYGKSKRQIKKTSAFLIDEIEQKYENSVVLIYKNYIYIFSYTNELITVYKNERIPL